MRFIKRLILILCSCLFAGCISSTKLNSSDPQAEIYVNEDHKNMGALEYKDRKILFQETDVQIRKTGCKTKFYRISRGDEFAPEGFFLGIFTSGIGFLWVTKYHSFYDLNFRCEVEAKAP